MGDDKAKELIEDLGQNDESDVFRVLRKIDPSQLAAYLVQEQPQTIALMLSYLQAKRSAAIIKELPDETEVYPGHDYGSKPVSTLAWEKKHNKYFLCKDFEEFEKLRMNR